MTKTIVIETKNGETKDVTKKLKRELRKGKVNVVMKGGGTTVVDLGDVTGRVSIGTMTTSGAGTVRIMKM